MDWNNIVVIILWLYVARSVIGAGYGIRLIRKGVCYGNMDWRDIYIVGILFWTGYAIWKGFYWLVETLRT